MSQAAIAGTVEQTSTSVIVLLQEAAPFVDHEAGRGVGSMVDGELKKLVQHSSHYMVGLIANLMLGLASFPIFTRVFSVAEYGTIDLVQRILLMVTIASKAGFQNAALRFYNREQFAADKPAAQTYYSTMFFGMLFTSALGLLVFLVIAWLAPQVLMGFVAYLVYFIAGLVLLRALGSVLWAFLRIEERTKAFNAASVGMKVATIAAICALLPWAGRTAQAYFGGTLVVEAVVIAGLSLWLLRRRVLDLRCFDANLFRTGLAFGMPLIVYELAFAVLASADRFLVRHYLGADALGFYSVAHGLARTANEFLVAPLSLAILPIYMRMWTSDGAGAEKTTNFLTVSLDLFLIAACGILAGVAASGHAIVVLLASAKYSGADRIIPVLLAGLLVYAAHVFVAAGLLIHKRTLQMAGILVGAAVVNVCLNVVLLPRMGLMGGAVSTLLSYTFCIVLLGYASNRVLPLRVNLQSLAKYASAAAAAWFLASRIDIASPAITLLGRSVITLTVYGSALYAMDARVRGGIRWGFAWCQERF